MFQLSFDKNPDKLKSHTMMNMTDIGNIKHGWQCQDLKKYLACNQTLHLLCLTGFIKMTRWYLLFFTEFEFLLLLGSKNYSINTNLEIDLTFNIWKNYENIDGRTIYDRQKMSKNKEWERKKAKINGLEKWKLRKRKNNEKKWREINKGWQNSKVKVKVKEELG